MKVTRNKNGDLVITVPVDEQGTPSGSGKSLIHASTRGNVKTDLEINGQPVVLSLNVYTKRQPVTA